MLFWRPSRPSAGSSYGEAAWSARRRASSEEEMAYLENLGQEAWRSRRRETSHSIKRLAPCLGSGQTEPSQRTSFQRIERCGLRRALRKHLHYLCGLRSSQPVLVLTRCCLFRSALGDGPFWASMKQSHVKLDKLSFVRTRKRTQLAKNLGLSDPRGPKLRAKSRMSTSSSRATISRSAPTTNIYQPPPCG
jgi:hypothetical protein